MDWSSYLLAVIFGPCVRKAATCLKGSGYKEAHGFICISLVHHANGRALQSIKLASLLYTDVRKQVQTNDWWSSFPYFFSTPSSRSCAVSISTATITWQPFTWAPWSRGPHHGPVSTSVLIALGLRREVTAQQFLWWGKWFCLINRVRLSQLGERESRSVTSGWDQRRGRARDAHCKTPLHSSSVWFIAAHRRHSCGLT